MSRFRAGAVAASSVLLLAGLLDHRPGEPAGNADDPTALVVAAAAWVAWALAIYLATALTLACALHARSCPGAAHRVLRLTPCALQRAVEIAVGASATALVVSVAPAAALADGPAPAPVSAAAPLDWPGLPTVAARPAIPPAGSVGLVSAAARRERTHADEIVVRPGDSLWTLTARLLGPSASPAQIAAAWPQVYAANRAVIGTDPDLIQPGQRLVPPAPDPRSPR